MVRTLIIFGLKDVMLEVDRNSPFGNIRLKSGAKDFVDYLKEMAQKDTTIGFHISSSFSLYTIYDFYEETDSADFFNREVIHYGQSRETNAIYNSIWHDILKYKSKRVFDIAGYDKVILIDSIKAQRLDFFCMKRRLWFSKNKGVDRYNNCLWAYIYGRDFEKIKKDLEYVLKKEKGVIIR